MALTVRNDESSSASAPPSPGPLEKHKDKESANARVSPQAKKAEKIIPLIFSKENIRLLDYTLLDPKQTASPLLTLIFIYKRSA